MSAQPDSTPNQVPVRELNQHTARVLERVQHGEELEITSHGRPLARLVPIEQPGLAHLRAAGMVLPAEEELDLDSPLDEPSDEPSLADAISADREDRL